MVMEDRRLQNDYDAEVVGEEKSGERLCRALMLTAGRADVACHSRRICMDKERFVSLREERYAKSGKMIKTTKVKNIRRIDGRWFPVEIVFKDELKAGEGTELIVGSVEFNADIPDYIFSKASLRK